MTHLMRVRQASWRIMVLLSPLLVVLVVLLQQAQAQQIGSTIVLQSVNYPDHYIRHQGYRGKITPIQSDLDNRDRSFVVRGGLAGTGISFESVNFPGYFLRHRNFEIWLDRYDGSDLFRKDATFIPQAGNAGYGVSYRSFNYPDHYIRHQNFLLYIHRFENSDLYRKDTTFQPQLASVGSGLFQSRWDKVAGPGGPWTTGWVPNVGFQGCGHQADGCSCYGQNYCGTYGNGDTTYWWPHGCGGPQWVIRCTSVPQ